MSLVKNYKLKEFNIISYLLSLIITTIILLFFLVNSTQLHHWFVLPIYITGVIIFVDAVEWIRGNLKTLDPIGFIGVFGFHFFFLAPLLFIYWESNLMYVENPSDWRTWIGYLSIVNLIGIIIYKFTRSYFFYYFLNKNDENNMWKIDKRKTSVLLLIAMTISFIIQTAIYIKYGGISSYIRVYTENEGSFNGMGWLFMISESFPILMIIFIAINHKKNDGNKSQIYIILLFIILFLVRMYFGGLRGSRSNTLWILIWSAGIVHVWLRPLSRKALTIGIIFLLLFSFLYGVYKGARSDFSKIFSEETTVLDLAKENDRGLKKLLLGDLSRVGIQSFIIYRQTKHSEEYDLAFGRSYLGDMSILIPRRVWPSRPPTVVKEGTEIIRGKETYTENSYKSSRIHGLQGEFSLNFGYYFSPLIFIVFSLFIAKVRSLLFIYRKDDLRTLLYPFILITCFLMLVQDLDNFIFGIVKNLSIPMIILFLGKKRN